MPPWLFFIHCCPVPDVALFLSLFVFNVQSNVCIMESLVISIASVVTEVLLVVAEVVGGTIVTCDSREEGSRIMSRPRCSTSRCPTVENDSNRCQTLTGFRQEQDFCWNCSSEPITELSHCHSFLNCWPVVCVCVYVCNSRCLFMHVPTGNELWSRNGVVVLLWKKYLNSVSLKFVNKWYKIMNNHYFTYE